MPFDPNAFFILNENLFGIFVGGPVPVSVYDLAATGYAAQTPSGAAVAAQIVAMPGTYGPPGSPHHIQDLTVQWCGYAQDHTFYSVLPGSGGPDIMLTPTMDGCSFGIGHSAPDGTCIVTHANKASAQTAINSTTGMQKAQAKAIKAFYRTQPQALKYTLKPDDYRWAKDDGDWRTVGMASSFGLRQAAHWRFYRHKYTRGMGTYDYFGLSRIK